MERMARMRTYRGEGHPEGKVLEIWKPAMLDIEKSQEIARYWHIRRRYAI